MSLNYGGLFESWEIAVAKKVINDYRKDHTYLAREGLDDLLQECLMRWLDVRDRYDTKRGASKRTYMAEVVRNMLINLAEKASADKRKAIYESVSLDEPFDDNEDEPALKDKLTESDDVLPQIKSELKLELSRVYQKLTPQQQKLCKLLGEEGLTISEASRQLNKHRMIIHREIARIRELFEKEGLRDYLK
ncbi:MAG TPA: sigma-70 family RNA polymerase sigma factor [Candidatus Omnitrophota bacterium]|nr:sigma-70 family RNA polymerase sigma factor [Candidatus Omnitrophota bacterium]